MSDYRVTDSEGASNLDVLRHSNSPNLGSLGTGHCPYVRNVQSEKNDRSY